LQESQASLYSGAQTNAKLISMKVTVGTYSLHRLPIERLQLLLMYKVPNKTTIQTDWVINCAGACGGIVLKCSHQIVMCEMIILALCCACSLQKYQFPAGNSQQKKTYKICKQSVQKTLVTKSCASLPLPYVAMYIKCMSASTAQVKRSHIDVDLNTVHTCVRVLVHPSK